MGPFLSVEATITVLIELSQGLLAFRLQVGPAGGFFRFAELAVAVRVILAVEALKGFLAGLLGRDLFGGVELAVLLASNRLRRRAILSPSMVVSASRRWVEGIRVKASKPRASAPR